MGDRTYGGYSLNYLTIDEAAKEIGVSNWTISRWLKEGKLSGRVFIASTAVEKTKQARDQKQQNRQQPPAPPSLLDYAGVQLDPVSPTAAELTTAKLYAPVSPTEVKIYTGNTPEEARRAYYNEQLIKLKAQVAELEKRFNTPLAGQ
jgi:DNA-binding transcriptional MerR regulator